MGASIDTSKAIAGNSIQTLTIVGWAQDARGSPTSIRLTRQAPPPVTPELAWRGEVLPNGPPQRQQSQLPPPNTNELTVTVAELVGSGRCGTVLAVDTLRLTNPHDRKIRLLYPEPPYLPELVIKIAEPGHEENLKKEAALYEEMEPLQGVSIPRAYGLFSVDLDPKLRIPSLSSETRRLTILLLERAGEALPLGEHIHEEGDLWDVFRDLARLGIEHTDIRYSNIRFAPTLSSPLTLPALPCPYHHTVHTYRIIDFDHARKTDFTLKRHFYNTAASLTPLIENMKNGNVLDEQPRDPVAERPSAL